MVKTGWKKAAVDDALAFLEDLELIERPHYRQWSLASGFYQLPLPFSEVESPKNGLSALVSVNPESPKNGTSADSEKSCPCDTRLKTRVKSPRELFGKKP